MRYTVLAFTIYTVYKSFPHSSVGKESAAMQETPVRFLGWEDLLEKGMAVYSSILVWRIPWTEEPGRLLCPSGFSRQESWSGLPFPTPGDLPDPGIQPMSLASPALAGGFFTPSATSEVQR